MGMLLQKDNEGYYDVHVSVGGDVHTYRIYARSDYAAAREVHRLTGVMPRADQVFAFIPPPFHGRLDMVAA